MFLLQVLLNSDPVKILIVPLSPVLCVVLCNTRLAPKVYWVHIVSYKQNHSLCASVRLKELIYLFPNIVKKYNFAIVRQISGNFVKN